MAVELSSEGSDFFLKIKISDDGASYYAGPNREDYYRVGRDDFSVISKYLVEFETKVEDVNV